MLEAKCDYLEFTVPFEQLDTVRASLPGGTVPMGKGWRGYANAALVAGGAGRVGWSLERVDMGVHVSLGAKALDTLALLDDRWGDRGEVCAWVLDDLGGKVTRFDAAFDDMGGALDMGVIEGALERGEYTSRWRSLPYTTRTLGAPGQTIYLGSARSDVMLLIYDKAAERNAKGEAFEGHWIRAELRLRRERANAAARLFSQAKDNAKATMAHLAGVLRGYLEFKTPNAHDTNKRRWQAAGWWASFLGHVEKARLPIPKPDARTVEDVQNWLVSQVSPSLALLEDALGFDKAWAFLFQEAQEGRSRMGARHRAILATVGETA